MLYNKFVDFGNDMKNCLTQINNLKRNKKALIDSNMSNIPNSQQIKLGKKKDEKDKIIKSKETDNNTDIKEKNIKKSYIHIFKEPLK